MTKVLQILGAVNLALAAILMLGYLTVGWTNATEIARMARTAQANELEWRSCERKHEMLLRQIRKEGLWRRLGLGGTPWLQ